MYIDIYIHNACVYIYIYIYIVPPTEYLAMSSKQSNPNPKKSPR